MENTLNTSVALWLDEYEFTHAVSLHFKYSFATRTKGQLFQDQVDKCLKIFINQVNRRFYQKSSNRKDYRDPRLNIIPTIENLNYGSFGPVHLHLALGNFPNLPEDEIRSKIWKAWAKVPYAQVDDIGINILKIVNSSGWVGYITKERYFNRIESIQLDCVQLSSRRTATVD